jgi:hypothetical protein
MTEIAGAGATADVLFGDQRRGGPEEAERRHECANCGAGLQGPYCHACGQRGHLHTRLWHLFHELIEGITHLDGRLWRTLPLLAFRPGRLSREWREGKRARYTSPLHVFLFAIFLLFIIPSFTGRHLISLPDVREAERQAAEDMARERPAAADAVPVAPGITVRPKASLKVSEEPATSEAGRRFQERWKKVKQNPEFYSYKIESLAYKLSFVIVPLSMTILWLLMLFKRGYTLYDHGVVSLYGVGFFVLLLAFATALPASAANVAVRSVLLIAPVHAIVHLHGAYRLSWFGAVLRGLLLGLLSSIGFGLFLLAVIAIGAFT